VAIFHTYIDDSTPGGEDAVAGIGSDTLYGVSASRDFKVSGISTFSGTTEFDKVKFLKDSTGDIGNSGQILSSTGSGIDWINSNTTNVNSASNIGVNENSTDAEQWLTFVGAKSGNNPIRVDDDLRYNPSTNVLSVKGITLPGDDQKITIGADDPLEIQHNSTSTQVELKSDAIISIMSGSAIELENESGGNIARFVKSSGCELYHNVSNTSTLRLETTDAGVTVTGTVSATTFSGALNGSASGSSGSCTGNAATATALETARTIGGTSFDGSANITPGVSGGLTGTPDIAVTDIDIAGALTDKNDITGTSGQVLTSTQTGVAWANAGTLAAGAAAQVAVANEATDTSCFPVFAIKATGADIALKSNAGLKFDSDTGALEATSFVKTSGTSSEFLKADGSVDTSTYLTSQVQSDWNSSTAPAAILNKPTLFSGAYGDLTGKPTLVTAFTGLSDAPANYTSQASKFVAVKADASGLEFVNNPNTDTQRAIHDTPSNGSTAISISSNWAYDHKELEGNSAHVPAAGSGNGSKFLANDGSWKLPSYTTNTNTTYGISCTDGDNTDEEKITLTPSAGTADSIVLEASTGLSIARNGDKITFTNTDTGSGGNSWRGIDDTPVDGQTSESISSNWAFDHNAGTGNSKHVPAAGSAGQFLKHDGTWGTPNYNSGANYYCNGLAFDTGTGVLTASINGATNQTVDLDGRYIQSGGNAATSTKAFVTESNTDTISRGIVFCDAANNASGNKDLKYDRNLVYNANSNTLVANNFQGTLGNFTNVDGAIKIRTDNGDAYHNILFVDSTTDNQYQTIKMDDEASRLQWNPNDENLVAFTAQTQGLRQWSDGGLGSSGQVLTSGGSGTQWSWQSISALDGPLTIGGNVAVTGNLTVSGNLQGGGQTLIDITNAVKTDRQSRQSTAWIDVTGLSISVTAKSASSKFLIICNVNVAAENSGGHDALVRLMRGTTPIGNGTDGSSVDQRCFGQSGGQVGYYETNSVGITILDSPGAGTHVYHVEFRSGNAGAAYKAWINKRGASSSTGFSPSSSITVMEFDR